MDTIADTSSLQFKTVVELMSRLTQIGVTELQLQQVLNNSGSVREVGEVLMSAPPMLPRRLTPEKREEFIAKLFPAKFDGEGKSRATVQYALYGDERAWLEGFGQIRHLLSLLSKQQLLIVLERSGLDGRPAVSAKELGIKLSCSTNQVNRIRGQARRIMIDEVVRLIDTARRTHRFQLPRTS